MWKICDIKLMMLLTSSIVLTACQSAQVYNGVSGYHVHSKLADSAFLSYTLSVRGGQINQAKLQKACQEVLGGKRTYQIDILSQQEIVNPQTTREVSYGITTQRSQVRFGFTDSPSLYDSQGYATRQALDVQPSMLSVVNFRCS